MFRFSKASKKRELRRFVALHAPHFVLRDDIMRRERILSFTAAWRAVRPR